MHTIRFSFNGNIPFQTVNNLSEFYKLPNFDNIQYLNICNRNLYKMPKLPKNLKDLVCCSNFLTSVGKLPKTLEVLYCNCNCIKSLPKNLPPNLKLLYIENNQLTKLSNLPDSIEHLSANHNKLIEINNWPKSLNTASLSFNNIKNLPDEFPPDLETFTCIKNKLKFIPKLPNSMQYISVACNKIKALPENIEAIYFEACFGHNQINDIPYDLDLSINYHLYGNPIGRKIYRYFGGCMDDYMDFKKKMLTLYANKIGEWFLKCKYDPQYKYCRNQVMKQYTEIFKEENNEENKSRCKKTKIDYEKL